MDEYMVLEFDGDSRNESFARVTVAAFVTRLDPTLEEIADIKTAVSEAVTNCVIHGYESKGGRIRIETRLLDRTVTITVKDFGIGIENISLAMEPLYTTKPEMDRSGMGFAFMEAFMDELSVDSQPGEGTTVVMKKRIGVIEDKSSEIE
ncbi:MAG: anti-sigma F factor [Lachnospiraceae bacterium]|nr:anti-sigma F factor [Lachnospiraceae bacterium]